MLQTCEETRELGSAVGWGAGGSGAEHRHWWGGGGDSFLRSTRNGSPEVALWSTAEPPKETRCTQTARGPRRESDTAAGRAGLGLQHSCVGPVLRQERKQSFLGREAVYLLDTDGKNPTMTQMFEQPDQH